MADTENQYHKPVVFEGANEAVISDAIFPEPAQSALETCSNLPRIVRSSDALAEKLQNSLLDGLVEFIQFLQRCWVELNLPSHSAASLLRAEWFGCAPSGQPRGAFLRDRCLPVRPDV